MRIGGHFEFPTNYSKHFASWAILSMLASILLLAGGFLLVQIIAPGKLEWDGKIGITLFTTVPLFVLTILQLARTQQIQRAGYIKDFLAEFRRNDKLYDAYYDLIYSYRDELWEDVKKTAEQLSSKPSLAQRPWFPEFADLNGERQRGSRLYHPAYFQFSLEESRLDGVFDYFNSLGFYLYEGLIRMEDVVSTLGDYIEVLSRRQVVQYYLAALENGPELDERISKGARKPYQHLQYLIERFRNFNKQAYNAKKVAELKEEIRQLQQGH
ncbi:MAG TPA: hypothetical protein VGV59_09420 [Pyrinomonadaceae bacterium]|nr:hypothetical protein [Pyrinomonadaceae bacterium]